MAPKSWLLRAAAKSKKVGECIEFHGVRNWAGYGRLTVGYGKIRSVHRLSFKHFKGPIPEGHVVRHTCDNRACWNPVHLITGTDQQNVDDMMERGRDNPARGQDHYAAKLNDDQITEIKRLLECKVTQQDIAKLYGVNQAQISRIKNNKAWCKP